MDNEYINMIELVPVEFRNFRSHWYGGYPQNTYPNILYPPTNALEVYKATKQIIEPYWGRTFDDILYDSIKQHGIFWEKYFEKKVKSILKELLKKKGYSLQEVFDYEGTWRLIDGKKTFYSQQIIWGFVLSNFSLYATFNKANNNERIKEKYKKWIWENSSIKKCKVCGINYRVIDYIDWMYYAVDGYKECCLNCPNKMKPKKHELIPLIKKLIDTCGRVPSISEFGVFISMHKFMETLNDRQKGEILTILYNMGGISHLLRKFKSWFKALLYAKIFHEARRMTRGTFCLAEDKHQCRSIAEKTIDDWFYFNNIDHEVEPKYPVDEVINPKGMMRADWKVKGVYIEYFGLLSDKQYKMKAEKKKKLCSIHKLKMISLTAEDITELDKKLTVFLSR